MEERATKRIFAMKKLSREGNARRVPGKVRLERDALLVAELMVAWSPHRPIFPFAAKKTEIIYAKTALRANVRKNGGRRPISDAQHGVCVFFRPDPNAESKVNENTCVCVGVGHFPSMAAIPTGRRPCSASAP